ncbi:MAG: DUF4279 domain-containing protein [Bacteriovoracia bacterium]
MENDNYPGATSKVKVSLFIQDFKCSPERITEFLKKKPTITREKGLLYPPARSKQRFSFWKLELVGELDVDAGVKKLLRKVSGLKELKKRFREIKISIVCVIYFVGDDSSPTIALSSKTIERLNECDCAFNVDYYLFK